MDGPQRFSTAIQQGNAVGVMGCPKSTGLGGPFNFHVQKAEMLQ